MDKEMRELPPLERIEAKTAPFRIPRLPQGSGGFCACQAADYQLVTLGMKLELLVIVLLGLVLMGPVRGEGWLTGVADARELSKKNPEGKHVLLAFTSAGWMERKKSVNRVVFENSEFIDEVSKEFVLYKNDLRHEDKEREKKDSKMRQIFHVNSMPTVVMLDGEGREYARFSGVRFSSVKLMLEKLREERAKWEASQ